MGEQTEESPEEEEPSHAREGEDALGVVGGDAVRVDNAVGAQAHRLEGAQAGEDAAVTRGGRRDGESDELKWQDQDNGGV